MERNRKKRKTESKAKRTFLDRLPIEIERLLWIHLFDLVLFELKCAMYLLKKVNNRYVVNCQTNPDWKYTKNAFKKYIETNQHDFNTTFPKAIHIATLFYNPTTICHCHRTDYQFITNYNKWRLCNRPYSYQQDKKHTYYIYS